MSKKMNKNINVKAHNHFLDAPLGRGGWMASIGESYLCHTIGSRNFTVM
jgi:hypothetical protein